MSHKSSRASLRSPRSENQIATGLLFALAVRSQVLEHLIQSWCNDGSAIVPKLDKDRVAIFRHDRDIGAFDTISRKELEAVPDSDNVDLNIGLSATTLGVSPWTVRVQDLASGPVIFDPGKIHYAVAVPGRIRFPFNPGIIHYARETNPDAVVVRGEFETLDKAHEAVPEINELAKRVRSPQRGDPHFVVVVRRFADVDSDHVAALQSELRRNGVRATIIMDPTPET